MDTQLEWKLVDTDTKHLWAGHSTCVYNGKILFFGGMDVSSSSTPHKDVYSFDPTTKEWETLPSMLHATAYMPVEVLGDKIYVISGSIYRSNTKKVQCYDTKSGVWEEKNDFPHALQMTASTVVNDKIYVAGGWEFANNPIHYKSFYEYDQTNDAWIQLADMPAEVSTHGRLGYYENGIFFFGGARAKSYGASYDGDFNIYRYDMLSDTWSIEGRVPDGPNTLQVGNKIYLIGQTQSYEYSFATNAWTDLIPIPDPVVRNSEYINAALYATGGETGSIKILYLTVSDGDDGNGETPGGNSCCCCNRESTFETDICLKLKFKVECTDAEIKDSACNCIDID